MTDETNVTDTTEEETNEVEATEEETNEVEATEPVAPAAEPGGGLFDKAKGMLGGAGQGILNTAEKLTGKDLDRDGDVGQ